MEYFCKGKDFINFLKKTGFPQILFHQKKCWNCAGNDLFFFKVGELEHWYVFNDFAITHTTEVSNDLIMPYNSQASYMKD